MVHATRENILYRRDAKLNHSLLTPAEREKLLQPYLPTPPSRSPDRRQRGNQQARLKTKSRSKFGIRRFLKHQLHALIYIIVHTIFSVYIRIRQAYHAVVDRIFAILYYHHRTPELIKKDVKGLKRLPEHLSVILKLEEGGRGGAGLEGLVDEVAEVAAWCACAGIPTLSIYERTGLLKAYIPATHRAITRKFSSYFGSHQPVLSLRAPHVPSMESAPTTPTSDSTSPARDHLSMFLLSADDGRDSLVDLTKTLTEMSQRSKLAPSDISQELVDAEISASIVGEPDLLVLFGPSVELSGYPPWQIRLTEIFHVPDNQGVGYQVFLRALYSYANAQMRFEYKPPFEILMAQIASTFRTIGKKWTVQEDALLMSLHHVDENGRLSRGFQSLVDMVKAMKELAPHYGILNLGDDEDYTVFNVQQRLHHYLLPLFDQQVKFQTTAEILAEWRLLINRFIRSPFKHNLAADAELMESPTAANGPPSFEKACEMKKREGS